MHAKEISSFVWLSQENSRFKGSKKGLNDIKMLLFEENMGKMLYYDKTGRRQRKMRALVGEYLYSGLSWRF